MYFPPTFTDFQMRKIPGSPHLHNFNVRVLESGNEATLGIVPDFAGTLATKRLARNITRNTRPFLVSRSLLPPEIKKNTAGSRD